MAKRGTIPTPDPSRQVAFHQLLVSARKTWLADALSTAVATVDPAVVKAQLASLVPTDVQKILAASGVRDEYVFPTPGILDVKPSLVGYYRLLIGISQKRFYASGTGMNPFKSMELRDTISSSQRTALPEFCRAMSVALAELVRQVSPALTMRDLGELSLLTLGAQLQGGNNNAIGQRAIVDVFLAIREIVQDSILGEDERSLTLVNSAGRTVRVILASDPDVRIQEDFVGGVQNRVAIEVKGGTDKSNAHNRAGEAEKSHQKAKRQGFRDFWTIIAKKGLDEARLKGGSPTTNSWFDVAQVLGRDGIDWIDFKDRLAGSVGIPLAKKKTPSRSTSGGGQPLPKGAATISHRK